MPEERIEADRGLGLHADVVGELKALADSLDRQDAGSDAVRRRFARKRASAPASRWLPVWTRAGCLVDERLASASPRRSECTISEAMPLAGMRERW